MGRGRGRRYFRFGSFNDSDGNFQQSVADEFEIFSFQEDGVTPTTFENAIEIGRNTQGLFPSFIEETITIEYEIDNGSIFSLEDEDGDISNGFQVNGSDIDVDRAINDLNYIIQEDLIGQALLTSDNFNGSFAFEEVDFSFQSDDLSSDTTFDDFASTEAGQSITIDVLANDLDVDDNGFEFSASPSSSEGGTVEIEHGQILFTPGEDFVGTDSFTYDLLSQDGQNEVIDTAIVTVEVSEAIIVEPVEPSVSFEPVFGTIDGDVIEVEGENQLIFAGSSNDLIDALTGEGENRIYAGSGDDTLIMGESDRAFGENGSDRFFFTAGGNNTITGGEGADQFWIATAEIPDAPNTITDFTIGEDVIGIAGLEIGFGEVTLTQQGNDALIATTGNDLALLEDIDITNLSESDFAFG